MAKRLEATPAVYAFVYDYAACGTADERLVCGSEVRIRTDLPGAGPLADCQKMVAHVPAILFKTNKADKLAGADGRHCPPVDHYSSNLYYLGGFDLSGASV